MKSGPRRVFRYSSTHEKALPDRPFRCRMELHRTPHARPGRGVDAVGEGMGQGGLETVDWQRLMPPKGFVVLPSRWVVKRTLSWIDQNKRMNLEAARIGG
jgi:hypothetical protein